jgi:hypothetical protein
VGEFHSGWLGPGFGGVGGGRGRGRGRGCGAASCVLILYDWAELMRAFLQIPSACAKGFFFSWLAASPCGSLGPLSSPWICRNVGPTCKVGDHTRKGALWKSKVLT